MAHVTVRRTILDASTIRYAVVHELGHFVAATLLKMRVLEVRIGSAVFWSPTALGTQWRIGVLPSSRSYAKIHGEGLACSSLSPSDRLGAMHCSPAKHQLLVAASGLIPNALIIAAGIVWASRSNSLYASLVALTDCVNSLHDFLVAFANGYTVRSEHAQESIVALWPEARLACCSVMVWAGSVIAFSNLIPIPMTDGWHIRRSWREIKGAAPLSEKDWAAYTSLDQQNGRKLRLIALVFAIPIAAYLFH